MINTPDLETSATKAMQVLIDNRITATPIDSMQILLRQTNVRVMPFAKVADEAEMERDGLISLFGSNKDAATFHLHMKGIEEVEYVVCYNMFLQTEVIRRAIARELGHIVLGHDGSTRTKSARMAEAMCFAHHLLSPRPILFMLQEAGLMTMNVLTETLGCSESCVDDMKKIQGVHVSPDLNRTVRDLFSSGINEYIRFRKATKTVDTNTVDFGLFMQNYEE